MIARIPTAVLLSAALILPASALAQDVQLGINPIVNISPSGWDFGPLPLPADFFGPGSDPFDGGVPAENAPVGTSPACPGDLGDSNVLLQRNDIAVLPGVPASDVIDIQMIEMNLVSATPITVTYFGGLNPESWDVEITLSSSLPTDGTMTIRKQHANGGTFDAELLIQPHFTFTRVSDSSVRTLDGAGTYQDLVNAVDVPWVYAAPDLACPACVTNFAPGHDGAGKVGFALSGTSSFHTLLNGCVLASIPTLPQLGMIVAFVLLLAVGAYWIAAHRRVVR